MPLHTTKLQRAFLHSKVARRVFWSFVLCALLPILALAVVSMLQVSSQLTLQSQNRMREASKAQAMAIFERLESLDAELAFLAESGGFPSDKSTAAPFRHKDWGSHFRAIAIIHADQRVQNLFGVLPEFPSPQPGEAEHLYVGLSVLTTEIRTDGSVSIFLKRSLGRQFLLGSRVVGEVNPDYLWGTETASEMIETTVLDASHRPLSSSVQLSPEFESQAASMLGSSTGGIFTWRAKRDEYQAAFSTLFLKPRFHSPRWTVVVSESSHIALAPLKEFRTPFLQTLLLAFWVVLLLSLVQIRRSLVPLEKLREGTRRIASREFEAEVKVRSGDEFEDLAQSFNQMAHQLGQQFKVLKLTHEFDRAILASLDEGVIVDTVLTQMRRIVAADSFGLCLFDGEDFSNSRLLSSGPDGLKHEEQIRVPPEELRALEGHSESMLIADPGRLPSYVPRPDSECVRWCLVLPLSVNGRLEGAVSLCRHGQVGFNEEEIGSARRVANQVAVALSNVGLLERLDRLNWGTLTALARAIDAKSAWTAGHSERVTQVALRIGRAFGLPENELEVLQRGGLLHDIGKIATPPSILDKPGKLEPEEMRVMQDHVKAGVRILEPITGFADILPIVLHHHEWFNGSGYPAGLKGDQISLHGRIFAVADVYDALSSDRPYRPGWEQKRVLDYLREKAGTQFDPAVVEVFLNLMESSQETPKESPLPKESQVAALCSQGTAAAIPGD